MKHTIYNLIAAAALSFCAACFVSCGDQLNPKPEQVPSCDFDLKVTEVRQSHTFEWDVVGNQINIDKSEQELQELWVTSWNTCTVYAIGKDATFEGVNFSSSNAKAVKINKVDAESATLEWVSDSDTPVTITASAGDYTHSFQVYSKQVIRLVGFHVFVDHGDGVEKEYVHEKPGENSIIVKIEQEGATYGKRETYTKRVTLRWGKLEPENASFRFVRKFEELSPYPSAETKMSIMNHDAGLPPFLFSMVDWSEYEGKKGIADQNIGRLFFENIGMYFVTDSKTESGKLVRKGTAIAFQE